MFLQYRLYLKLSLLFCVAFLFCSIRHVYASNSYYVQDSSNGELSLGWYGFGEHGSNEVDFWEQDGADPIRLDQTDPEFLNSIGGFSTTTTDQYVNQINVWMAGPGIGGPYQAFYFCSGDTNLYWSTNGIDSSTLTSTPQEVTFYFDPKATNCNLKNSSFGYFGIMVNQGSNWPQGISLLASNNNPTPKVGLMLSGNTGLILDDYDIKIEIYTTGTQVVSKTPVLIVPGVLGTDLKKGDDLLWANPKMSAGLDSFMDPLSFDVNLAQSDSSITVGTVIRSKGILGITSHYVDGLIGDLVHQGYTEGKDLFTFPYDWRYGVSGKFSDGTTNVDSLKGQIDYILTQTDAGKAAGKVDVIAHSTGGLLVKKYVTDHPVDHHINKAVFVGVPNLGAPKAFKTLISGDDFGIPGLDPSEMKKISQNMPVVYDLAPTLEYYNSAGSFLHIHNPLTTPENMDKDLDYSAALQNFADNHLVNPLAVSGSQSLHTNDFDNFDVRAAGIDAYNIVGCKSATFNKVTEWVNLDSAPIFDYPQEISGDGTVPFASANSIPAETSKTFYVPKVQHSSLLSADGSRQEIVSLLSGANLDTGNKVLTHDAVQNSPSLCELKGEYIQIKSPVSVSVTDQSGNYSGLASDGSIQNDIPGADYEIWGEHKYVFLPTDDGQKYTVLLKGTGTGSFTVYDQTVENDRVAQTQVFSDLPVTPSLLGQINLGSSTTLSLDTDGDGNIDRVINTSAIIGPDQSLDLIAPNTAAEVTGKAGSKAGTYKGDVLVSLNAVDPVVAGLENEAAGVLETQFNLDSSGWLKYGSSTPIVISGLGQHTLIFYSIDRAGNKEQQKELSLSIEAGGESPSNPSQTIVSTGGGGSVYRFTGPTSSAVSVVSAQPQVLGESTTSQIHLDGSLIIFPGDPTVYLISGGSKHPFYSARDFIAAGYRFKDIQASFPGDAKMPLGMPYGFP